MPILVAAALVAALSVLGFRLVVAYTAARGVLRAVADFRGSVEPGARELAEGAARTAARLDRFRGR
jgi:hypothetical protein